MAPAMFGSLPVGDSIGRALAAMDYSSPTPIQEQAIPPLRAGRDVLGQAQTGTGKTAGFGIPLIEAIDASRRGVQAIVLVPTRELCLQVADELSRLGRFAGVRVLTVYGGVGFGKQLEGLARGSHVVVGTPGRVEDLLQRGSLRLDGVRLAVLDEADRMLDVGFLPAIERILRRTPGQRQTALFSATIPEEVRGLANRQMSRPVAIFVDPQRATVEEIDQLFERVPDGDKLSALRAHLDNPSCFLALVFRRTTYKVDRLVRDLQRRGYKAAALHGRRSQNQRERVLNDLKACKLQVLVATDIAARGLDISGLTHVFNFDLPDTPETYVHRIGRTGRAGESGTAITFVAPEDEEALRAIERYLRGRSGRAPAAGTSVQRARENRAEAQKPTPRVGQARSRRPRRRPRYPQKVA
jgi:ATP-dependent RNA helicase DeaD